MELSLPGIPPSKKNSKRIVSNRKTGRIFIISSKGHYAWHDEAVKQLTTRYTGLRLQGMVHSGVAVHLICDFYAQNRRKFDLSNKLESVSDLLVDFGIIEDDNYSIIREITARYMGLDKNNPRVEIKLYAL